ncbi:MAG: GLPGLI family protein [Bacteroides sp.]|nr:GLPGLI family protein [Bacteroides sp.]
MKKILFIAFLIVTIGCHGQRLVGLNDMPSSKSNLPLRDTIDHAVLCVHYKMWEVKDSREEKKKYRTYDMFLQIGKKMSKFSDYNRYLNDSTVVMEERRGVDNASIMMGMRTRGRGISTNREEIFKNYPNGSCTVYDDINILSHYCYEDSEVSFDWIIVPMEKPDTVMGYPCGKATTTFRGRTYEVWYTDEIAVDNGPWKFQGLPGLILYVKDTERDYFFKCTALYKPTWYSPMTKRREVQKTTRKKFVKAKRRSGEDPIGSMMDAGLITSIKAPDGSLITSSSMLDIPPYNPIELE